jgi:hypothetical protein
MNKKLCVTLSAAFFFTYSSYTNAIDPIEPEGLSLKEKTVLNALRHTFHQCPLETVFLGFGLVLTGGTLFSDLPYTSSAFGTAVLTQLLSYYFPELPLTQDPFVRTLFDAPWSTGLVLRALIADHSVIIDRFPIAALVLGYYILNIVKHYELIELEKEVHAEKEAVHPEQLT